MKKILAITIIAIAILFMAGCKEDDRHVRRNEVTIITDGTGQEVTVHATPEPATILLLGSGLIGLGVMMKKKPKK